MNYLQLIDNKNIYVDTNVCGFNLNTDFERYS